MKKRNDLFTAAGFLTPNLAGFLVFLAIPLLVSLAMSFTNWHLNQSSDQVSVVRPIMPALQWVGLRNYTDLIGSGEFWTFFVNTLYLMVGIPFGIAGSLILALMLNKPLQHNTRLGRAIHAVIAAGATVVFAVVASSMTTGDAMASRIIAGVVFMFGVLYLLGVLSGVVVFRTAYYLPSFVAGVAIYILWKNLYNTEFGPINLSINYVLDTTWSAWSSLFGGTRPEWMDAPKWLSSTNNLLGLDPERVRFTTNYFGLGAREALIIMGLVTGVGGGNMLLYLAGLSNIPPELYEAAEIDGAGKWATFWAVTWPQLAPTTFFIVVMSCIGGLQGGFDAAKTMTNGGPSDTTTTLNFFIYNHAFVYGNLGFACAIAWALFALVFVVTLVNWQFGNRQLND